MNIDKKSRNLEYLRAELIVSSLVAFHSVTNNCKPAGKQLELHLVVLCFTFYRFYQDKNS